ncbi:hypothetical protein SAMN04488007_1817 [Maribacter aquivivus]|uniref:Uncharacterized protein n=1 Tax=Maribacter aquivivus TaxID=228958 RepID=A0A1M6MYR9_9FLAO|nr:hypothetical protein SAMN04488007_1817 [Maribacter aquivivus]
MEGLNYTNDPSHLYSFWEVNLQGQIAYSIILIFKYLEIISNNLCSVYLKSNELR